MVKLVIDTDGVCDDIRAICMALTRPGVEVLAITCVQGCTPVHQAALNVIRAQRASGIEKRIPVYMGAADPLIAREVVTDETSFFGKDGLGDTGEKQDPKTRPDDDSLIESDPSAIGLIKIFREHPDATLVAIGPLTNVALAMKLDPEFKQRPKRVVIMGGNYLGIGNVHSNSSAEWNFHGDPEAAHIVLSEMEAPITLVPWECFYIEGPKHQKIIDFSSHLQYETPLAKFLNAALEMGRIAMERNGRQYSYCDEIAVATAIDEGKVALKRRKMRGSVELSGKYSRGQIVLDWTGELWDADREKILPESRKLDLSRRPLTFVTEYDVHVIDSWLHESCKNSTKLSEF
ncbi:unnamed protein product, partial [Mesorhabditis belari]|uniref:Inosine/uridine-preferring nucleoside hydrolase domain-containing protein n=1 Tax=Mesorhabditis belari TaxID=2138241 RepID=A0AAF3EF59_9BILA